MRADFNVYVDTVALASNKSSADIESRIQRTRLAYRIARERVGHHIDLHGCDMMRFQPASTKDLTTYRRARRDYL